MGNHSKHSPSHELRPAGKPAPRRDASFHPLPPRNQKRSLAVPLLALGGATLVGLSMLGRGQDVQRNRYDSYEDCVHDYSSGQCQIDTSVNGGSYGGLHYYGPWYRSGGGGGKDDPGPGRALASGGRVGAIDGTAGPRGVELGTRGGFGSTGRVSARAS
ncbi:hypothetical protein SAMN04487785_104312 [Dyella jiangningensis]|uniref:hypothetical protein n=1 Tax=Dyella sp. AtDHG13 TaxID=1938897 RepID=UPI00088AAE23|nr:hypothetical protein [Dyella sp. AtDHG13]PXV61342.1 hypothetical protein BDW41_10171 [Dyella sp. AtDHG13]SDJ93702.1 hypothetical protein SAMN04487785_104312 [Dyella jiangningensis]